MSIKCVKIVMSRFGVTSLKSPKKVMYLPTVEISYQEKERKRVSVTIGKMVENKSLYKLELVGEDFFLIRMGDEEYHMYDENGKLTTKFKIVEVGQPILFCEDYCVFTQNGIFTYLNYSGEVIEKREMTDEEWNSQFE